MARYIYKTKSGDTWDTIAKTIYDNEYFAGDLMAVNPEHIGTFIFSEGIEITAYDAVDETDGSMPPWKFEAGEEDEEEDVENGDIDY